jgi:pimeloyl-ACP methyl ester carboxylesterase
VLPETRYAKKGDDHVAYQVSGEGPLDLVLVSTWFSHLDARWDSPGFAHYLRRLSSFSRLISFDKSGNRPLGPIPSRTVPPLEDWMDDVRAVMDAVGSERAAIMGANDGSLMAELFAATHPERTSALVLVSATARISAARGTRSASGPTSGAADLDRRTDVGHGDLMTAVNPAWPTAPKRPRPGAASSALREPATAAAVMRDALRGPTF